MCLISHCFGYLTFLVLTANLISFQIAIFFSSVCCGCCGFIIHSLFFGSKIYFSISLILLLFPSLITSSLRTPSHHCLFQFSTTFSGYISSLRLYCVRRIFFNEEMRTKDKLSLPLSFCTLFPSSRFPFNILVAELHTSTSQFSHVSLIYSVILL